jgi:hypothetical protein
MENLKTGDFVEITDFSKSLSLYNMDIGDVAEVAHISKDDITILSSPKWKFPISFLKGSERIQMKALDGKTPNNLVVDLGDHSNVIERAKNQAQTAIAFADRKIREYASIVNDGPDRLKALDACNKVKELGRAI